MEEDESVSDPALVVDERALEEAEAEFDDPEQIVLLEDGVDDAGGFGPRRVPQSRLLLAP